MIQDTIQCSITSQTIVVEHIVISSRRPLAEVCRKLEGTVPTLDAGVPLAIEVHIFAPIALGALAPRRGLQQSAH
jgi:hypothetical protein